MRDKSASFYSKSGVCCMKDKAWVQQPLIKGFKHFKSEVYALFFPFPDINPRYVITKIFNWKVWTFYQVFNMCGCHEIYQTSQAKRAKMNDGFILAFQIM